MCTFFWESSVVKNCGFVQASYLENSESSGDEVAAKLADAAAAAAIMLGVLDPLLIYLLLVPAGCIDCCDFVFLSLDPTSSSRHFFILLDSCGFLKIFDEDNDALDTDSSLVEPDLTTHKFVGSIEP